MSELQPQDNRWLIESTLLGMRTTMPKRYLQSHTPLHAANKSNTDACSSLS